MSAAAALPAETITYNAVCYKCHYVGMEAAGNRCPLCSFPLILEPGRVEDAAPYLEEIFDRTSVSIGAPPLPGVDARKRKAQLLAEARQRRYREKVARRSDSETGVRAATAPGPRRRRRASTMGRIVESRTGVTVAFLSAMVAGFAAALMVNGGL